MFRHEGPSRDARTNWRIAGYLAFVAGFVNSAGFILVHAFTSHVTGSVGRFAHEVATVRPAHALSAASLVVSFFGGAFAASMLLEAHGPARRAVAYAIALVVQGVVLAAFVVLADDPAPHIPARPRAAAALLCFALGMQNSLVTRLSGAVVRTTHLTGVVTDLAIESARWCRFLLGGRSSHPQSGQPEPAHRRQVALLGIIFGAFVTGSILGATLALATGRWAMALPTALVWFLGGHAYSQRGEPVDARVEPPSP